MLKFRLQSVKERASIYTSSQRRWKANKKIHQKKDEKNLLTERARDDIIYESSRERRLFFEN